MAEEWEGAGCTHKTCVNHGLRKPAQPGGDCCGGCGRRLPSRSMEEFGYLDDLQDLLPQKPKGVPDQEDEARSPGQPAVAAPLTARADTAHDDLPVGEDPLLAELKGCQRTRARHTEIEEHP